MTTTKRKSRSRIPKNPRPENMAEHRRRLDMVEAMLISGARVRQVESTCSAEWGVQKRRARDYIAEVRQLWRKAAETDPETLEERRSGLVRTVRDVMYRALSDDDLARALNATSQLAILEGLNAPQKVAISGTVTHTHDDALPLELAKALRDVLQDATAEIRSSVRAELRAALGEDGDAT